MFAWARRPRMLLFRVVKPMCSKPEMCQRSLRTSFTSRIPPVPFGGCRLEGEGNPMNLEAQSIHVGVEKKYELPFTTSCFGARSFRFVSRSLQVVIH